MATAAAIVESTTLTGRNCRLTIDLVRQCRISSGFGIRLRLRLRRDTSAVRCGLCDRIVGQFFTLSRPGGRVTDHGAGRGSFHISQFTFQFR
jgi:hypothetical protein